MGNIKERHESTGEPTQEENVTKVVEVVERQKELTKVYEGDITIKSKIDEVLSILLQQKEQPGQEIIHDAIGKIEVSERKRKQVYISTGLGTFPIVFYSSCL